MFLIIGRPKNIYDLTKEKPLSLKEPRKNIEILVIDDDGFLYEDILRNHGFNIKVLKDIQDVKAVEPYPIVVCDIKGVGKGLGSPYEGAHVIEEIHKFYPYKILIAYSGQTFDNSFNRFFGLCDFSMKKDAGSDEWIERLDRAILNYVDPVKQWEKIRALLLARGVNVKRVLELEDHYVNSCLKKKAPFQNAEYNLEDLSLDLRQVLIGVASNVISGYLTSPK